MRKSNTQPLGDVLKEYVRSMNMERKLKEMDVVASWEAILGKTIAHYTRKIYLSKKILYVELTSSVVKNELMMMRENIRLRLNEEAGEEMVNKIVIK
jgi:predicted nucleic acid-binding Zn ribbon protein